MIPENDHKKATLLSLLGSWPAVLFWCDSRQPGAVVPEGFVNPRLVLRVGYNMSPDIVDLVVDDTGVSAGLSFNQQPFRVTIPWAAIYMTVPEGDDRMMVWPNSVPSDVKLGGDESAPPVPATPAKRGHLKLVP